MQSIVTSRAASLQRQFDEASSRWPNLVSALVLWPEGTGGIQHVESLPDEFKSTISPAVPAPAGEIYWVSIGWGYAGDTPGKRYREGHTGVVGYWRRFGEWGNPRELIDPSEARQVVERFRVLCVMGNQLIDDLDGAGLTSATLQWQRETRWILAVHELTSPEEFRFPDHPFVIQWISELWLASAAAIDVMLSRPVSENDRRDRYCYEECWKGTPYKEIEAEVNRHSQWVPLNGVNSIKTAAQSWADRTGKSRIPKRQSGRPRKKA